MHPVQSFSLHIGEETKSPTSYKDNQDTFLKQREQQDICKCLIVIVIIFSMFIALVFLNALITGWYQIFIPNNLLTVGLFILMGFMAHQPLEVI